MPGSDNRHPRRALRAWKGSTVPRSLGTATLPPSHGTNRKRGKHPEGAGEPSQAHWRDRPVAGTRWRARSIAAQRRRDDEHPDAPPRMLGASSSASPRESGSMPQDFQTMAATGVGEDRVQFIWGSVQPNRVSFNWDPTDALIGALGLARHPAGPVHLGVADVGGPHPRPPPARRARRRSRRGRTSSRRRWRATDRAAATGPPSTAQRYGADAKPLPIQSWQIWNEPNLKKYFAPSPSVERVCPAASDLPRRDQEGGSAGPDRARRHARLRRRERLGLPRQPLLDARDQEATSTPSPCTRTRPTSTSSAWGSRRSAR